MSDSDYIAGSILQRQKSDFEKSIRERAIIPTENLEIVKFYKIFQLIFSAEFRDNYSKNRFVSPE